MKKLSKIMIGKETTLMTVLLCSLLVLMSSCDDTAEQSILLSDEEERSIVENNNEAETISNDELMIVDFAEEDFSQAQRTSNGNELCAERTWIDSINTLKVDFGEEGCVGPFGRTRKGIVYIQFQGNPGEMSNKKAISFENYFVNEKQISGEIFIDKWQQNEASNYFNHFTLEEFKVSFPNGESIVLNGQRKREFLEGIKDGKALLMELTGSISGNDSKGRSFTSDIIEPILADQGCAEEGGFIRTAGVKEHIYNGLRRNKVRTVNYGDGTCDNIIVITVNETTYTIIKS